MEEQERYIKQAVLGTHDYLFTTIIKSHGSDKTICILSFHPARKLTRQRRCIKFYKGPSVTKSCI